MFISLISFFLDFFSYEFFLYFLYFLLLYYYILFSSFFTSSSLLFSSFSFSFFSSSSTSLKLIILFLKNLFSYFGKKNFSFPICLRRYIVLCLNSFSFIIKSKWITKNYKSINFISQLYKCTFYIYFH